MGRVAEFDPEVTTLLSKYSKSTEANAPIKALERSQAGIPEIDFFIQRTKHELGRINDTAKLEHRSWSLEEKEEMRLYRTHLKKLKDYKVIVSRRQEKHRDEDLKEISTDQILRWLDSESTTLQYSKDKLEKEYFRRLKVKDKVDVDVGDGVVEEGEVVDIYDEQENY